MKIDLKPGMIFYRYDGYESENGKKCHVVSVLKKEPQTMIVFKYFGTHKRWWHYEIKSEYFMNLYFDGPGIFKLKKEKWKYET